MAFMDINIESMRGLMYFVGGRTFSPNEMCWVSDDGCIKVQLSNGDNTVINFVSMDRVEFEYAISANGPIVKKIVTRPSEFNGAIIEFTTKPREHFEDIARRWQLSPKCLKQYEVLDKWGKREG